MSKGSKRSEHQPSFIFSVPGGANVIKHEVMSKRRADVEGARREKLASRIAEEVSKRPIAQAHDPKNSKN